MGYGDANPSNVSPLVRGAEMRVAETRAVNRALQVKAYGAEYCGVSELRQASREQVESFVKHLAESASKDRDGLICQLNSYARVRENEDENDQEKQKSGAA